MSEGASGRQLKSSGWRGHYQWKLQTLLNEMAVLDGKPAMRVCGVDKGDDSERKTAETPARVPT